MKLKLISLFLALFMLILPLTACKKDEEQPTDSAEITTGASEEYHVEARDYGGKDFIILASTVSEDGGRHFSEYGGDVTGDRLNSSIFARDAAIMEKYNVNFKINTTVNWNTELTNAQMSDDLLFHIATPGVSNAVYSVSQGSIACLDDYSVFDFSRPWWQVSAMEQMKILGRHYFAVGDINLLAYDSVGIIFYSKQVARNYGFTDLHKHVEDGTWDYETFLGYVAKVTANTNGDQEYGAGDTFGYVAGSYSALCFTYAGNYSFVEKDVDGVPSMKADHSKFIEFFDTIVRDHSNKALIGYNIQGDDAMFKSNRLLFNINMLGMSADHRADEIEYGILPLPKWTSDQDTYYTFPHQSASTSLCIPISNREYDMTSRIMEDMAYHTYRDVLSYYIEENLFVKSLDGDEDSYNAVKISLSNLNCDIFFSYRAGITEMLRNCLDNPQLKIASQFKKYEKPIRNQLNGIVEGILES